MLHRGDDLPVLVVGAGPTGLTAATLLARLGVATTIVDRYTTPYAGPRAVHLDGEAVRVLQSIGLDAEFAAISRPAAGLRLLDGRLRPFAEFRRDTGPGPHGHPEANLFHQPDLEALLRAGLRGQGVEPRAGTVVTAVRPGGAGPVEVTLRDTTTGAERQLLAAAVLGCDGAGSAVRDAIGARLLDLRATERWFVVDVRCHRPVATWGGVDQVCDPRRAATFLHVAGDRYRWEFRMRPGETVDELARPARLAVLTAPWLSGFAASEWQLVRAAQYTFRAGVADRWRRGRVLLLGDAAHLMPPFVGQGMGAGLRDAHNLCWKLAAVLRRATGEDLLDSYQAERAPHAEATVRTAVRVGRAMTGGPSILAGLRRPIASALLRLPGAEARALAGTATRYPPGAVTDHRAHRRHLAGTPCPQPVVTAVGRRALLDGVLGDGYALLCTGPVEPDMARRARALGARTVRVVAGPVPAGTGEVVIGDDDGILAAWMRRGGASAVLLRPDRVVMAAAPSRSTAPRWPRWIRSSGNRTTAVPAAPSAGIL